MRVLLHLVLYAAMLHATAVTPLPAATYHVHPSGRDTNPGGPDAPFKTVAHAAAVATSPGDRVLVAPGTYPEPVVVRGHGTETQPLVFRSTYWAKAVLTGHVQPGAWPGDHVTGGANAHPYVTFEGFLFANTSNLFQLRMALGWRASSNVFQAGQNGINARADKVMIDSNLFRDLQAHAYVVYGSADAVIHKNTVRRVNPSGAADPAASAVSKFGHTTRLSVKGNLLEGNIGPGVWLDFENRDYTVEGNTARRNRGRTAAWQGPGFQTEINPGPGLFRHNVCVDNAGPCIAVLESAGVTIEDNEMDCGSGYAGVEFRNLPRGPGLANNVVRRNMIASCDPLPTTRGAAIKFAGGTQVDMLQAYENSFDQGASPLYDWFGTKVHSEAEACDVLGFECK
jgi:Right handed beta helix region